MKEYDICVIGGGAAGMSAALGAYERGAKNVILIEKEVELGGILNQCIHNGFGLHTFHEELTGPAYAEKLKDKLANSSIEILLETTVLKITPNKEIHYLNSKEGYQIIQSNTIILATGCRERTRYQIDLPGKRLAGIMTAGLAQRYLNMDGYLVGKRVFILGSGDIGLIMARRMTLEGAIVLGVAEIMPYSNGLNRNIVQCLNDYDIPLYLSHTVTGVYGDKRLEKITISQVDEQFRIIEHTNKEFFVDTLLLSIGLIPDSELLRLIDVDMSQLTNSAEVNHLLMTSKEGIFVCGNSLHVHDLVDYASSEGYEAGKNAVNYINRQEEKRNLIDVKVGNYIRYVIPNKIALGTDIDDIQFKFRVNKPLDKGKIVISQGNRNLKTIQKRHLLPAEMESVTLSTSLLTNDELVYITIEGVEIDD